MVSLALETSVTSEPSACVEVDRFRVDHRTELAVVEFEGERRILFYFDGRPRIAIGPDVGHPIVTFFDEAGTLQHTVASLDGRTMLLGTNDSQVSVTPDGEVIEKKGQG